SGAYLSNLLPKALEQLDALLADPDPAIRLRAVIAVADRVVGTPVQRSHVTTSTTTDPVTVEELAALAQTPEGRTRLLALATATDDD
ncbi:MAG TPA: hypothetical protein VHN78_05470, partial [Chloroflexota bacterium]|nr:hypothetical protein [Chloroflexota bacterium]